MVSFAKPNFWDDKIWPLFVAKIGKVVNFLLKFPVIVKESKIVAASKSSFSIPHKSNSLKQTKKKLKGN